MRVLIAENNRTVANLLAQLVREAGHEVVDVVTTGGTDVLLRFGRSSPDAVLMEAGLPPLHGLTIPHALLLADPHVKIILVSTNQALESPKKSPDALSVVPLSRVREALGQLH